MIYIGNHLSSSSGFAAMGRHADRLDASTFAFFTRNPRGGKAKALDRDDADALLDHNQKQKFGPLVAHASYTMNLCSGKENVRKFAQTCLADDLRRMEYLPGNFYNFHPGSHVGQGAEAGIRMIAEGLDQAVDEARFHSLPEAVRAGEGFTPLPENFNSDDDLHTTILLETMAGKGSEVGRTFEELKAIIDESRYGDKLGVCFDSCHVWDAGYDIAGDLDGVLDEFDRILGLSRLKAVHFNESMNECGSHKDRHARLKEGRIGLDAMKRIVQHPVFQGKPFILETPNEDAGYKEEIELVRSWMK
jgi:deoxyribonuclease-4